MYSLAVLEDKDEKIAHSIARAMEKMTKKHDTSIVITNSDSFAHLGDNRYDLLIVSPKSQCRAEKIVDSKCILLPGDLLDGHGEITSEYAISYGMSPRETITVSSLSQEGAVISLQRELVTLAGEVLEQQELPKIPLMNASPEHVMTIAGALLLAGVPPENINLLF